MQNELEVPEIFVKLAKSAELPESVELALKLAARSTELAKLAAELVAKSEELIHLTHKNLMEYEDANRTRST